MLNIITPMLKGSPQTSNNICYLLFAQNLMYVALDKPWSNNVDTVYGISTIG